MAATAEPLEQWMRSHGPAVLGLARRMLRDAHAAEDLFQATFAKAYCRALPFRDDTHARAWLLRVAANDCLSRLRSPWRRSVPLNSCRRGTHRIPGDTRVCTLFRCCQDRGR